MGASQFLLQFVTAAPLYTSLIAVTSLLVYLAIPPIYNLLFHPLRSFPGPILWRASALPWKLALLRGTMHHDVMRFHQRYGDEVRIKPDEISYASAQAWKDIHAHVPGRVEYRKDPMRAPNPPNGITNILVGNVRDHARFRGLFGHAFSDKGLRSQESTIGGYADLLVEVLGEQADNNTSVEMVTYYNMAIFDTIGALAFGESFHSLRDRKLHPWVDAIHRNLRSVAMTHVLRSLGAEFLAPYLLPKHLRTGRSDNYNFAAEKINRRMQDTEDRGDFWDRIVSKSGDNNLDGTGMSKGEMLNNGTVMVVAGSETSASALSGATYLLLKFNKLPLLQEELRSAFQTSDQMDLLSVARLPYLNAVLDETFRMYPSVPGQGPRVIPEGGAMVCNKFLPGETRAGVSHLGTYFADYNFTRPFEFLPERFLHKDSPEFRQDNYAAYQPFSVGIRNCIGKNLAYAELRLMLAKVFFHYDMELDHDRTGNFLDQNIWAIWAKNPLYVKIHTHKVKS